MDAAERQRYSRQILFPGIGERGQEALLRSHAAVVGCGALGSFHAAALARAGVGRLTIVDRDYVEPGNLHRQWLFEESDAAEVAAQGRGRRAALSRASIPASRCAAWWPISRRQTPQDLLGGADVILDGTDNFETRYLINDFAVSRGIPWIYGAAVGSYGLTMPVIPGRTACLRCVYPEPPAGVAAHLRDRRRVERDRLRGGVAPGGGCAENPVRARRTWCARASPRSTCGRAASARSKARARDPDCPACARREFPYLEESRSPAGHACAAATRCRSTSASARSTWRH